MVRLSTEVMMDHEINKLDRDQGQHHSEEAEKSIEQVHKIVSKMQQKNQLLKDELNFEARQLKKNHSYNQASSEEIQQMHEEAHQYTRKIEIAKRKLSKINLSFVEHESILLEQNRQMNAKKVLQHSEGALSGRIKKIEADLDRKMTILNQKMNTNRDLRVDLDNRRHERAAMDTVYTKMENEIFILQSKLAQQKSQLTRSKAETENVRQEIADLKAQGEIQEIEFQQKYDKEVEELRKVTEESFQKEKKIKLIKELGARRDERKETLADSLARITMAGDKSIKEGQILKAQLIQSKWKVTQEKIAADLTLQKYKSYKDFIEKMTEIAGTDQCEELADVFQQQEQHHFNSIQQVNELAHEIEVCRTKCQSLRDEIADLKSQQEHGKKLKMNREDEKKKQIQQFDEQRQKIEKKDSETSAFMAFLRPKIEMFHSRIGCKNSSGEDMKHVDIRSYIADIETRIVETLQALHDNRSTNHPMEGKPGMENTSTAKASSFLDMIQPFRYEHVRPPTLSEKEMRKAEVAEEYPLTYEELKTKVWKGSDGGSGSGSGSSSSTVSQLESHHERKKSNSSDLPAGWKRLPLIANINPDK